MHIDTHCELKVYREHEVLNIEPLADKHYRIHAQHQNQVVIYKSNYIILATGHLPNPKYAHLQQNGCQITPWDLPSYHKIPDHFHVGIVGTRLTAIDAILKLKQLQHQGTISLFSRSGLLSAVRGEHQIPKMNYLIPDNITKLLNQNEPQFLLLELIALLEQELLTHLPPPYNVWATLKRLIKLPPLERLQLEIKQAEMQETTWQSILSCFYQIIFKLWPQIPLLSKAHFLKSHSSLLISLLCSFPLEKAYVVQEMMCNGQLQVRKRLRTIDYASQHFVLHCDDNFYSCDHLILALGSGRHPEVLPLYKQMLEHGTIKKHSLGGVSVNLRTYQVHDKNYHNTSLYALGELVKGACFNMIEVGQVVEQGTVITNHILNQLN
jgi:hypothetical protein